MYSHNSSPPRYTLPPLSHLHQQPQRSDYYQKSTFSYSYPEEEYYPVYKQEWSPGKIINLFLNVFN